MILVMDNGYARRATTPSSGGADGGLRAAIGAFSDLMLKAAALNRDGHRGA